MDVISFYTIAGVKIHLDAWIGVFFFVSHTHSGVFLRVHHSYSGCGTDWDDEKCLKEKKEVQLLGSKSSEVVGPHIELKSLNKSICMLQFQASMPSPLKRMSNVVKSVWPLSGSTSAEWTEESSNIHARQKKLQCRWTRERQDGEERHGCIECWKWEWWRRWECRLNSETFATFVRHM